MNLDSIFSSIFYDIYPHEHIDAFVAANWLMLLVATTTSRLHNCKRDNMAKKSCQGSYQFVTRDYSTPLLFISRALHGIDTFYFELVLTT